MWQKEGEAQQQQQAASHGCRGDWQRERGERVRERERGERLQEVHLGSSDSNWWFGLGWAPPSFAHSARVNSNSSRVSLSLHHQCCQLAYFIAKNIVNFGILEVLLLASALSCNFEIKGMFCPEVWHIDFQTNWQLVGNSLCRGDGTWVAIGKSQEGILPTAQRGKN